MTQKTRPARAASPLVVATKLHIPPVAPQRRPRGALLARLAAERRAKLLLVSAPPGSGKTTLLASWSALPEEERAFAWLSLDGADNDFVRFWRYVVAALRTVDPAFGAGVLSTLRAPGARPLDRVVPLLLNALEGLAEPAVLVLDDFQAIENEDIHRSFAALLERIPASLYVAIASRSEPPIPLGRMRVRGEVLEVLTADLRLDDDQAAALLNGSLGLALEREQITRLRFRTEGWAAGLQLVGLSLRGRDDSRAYIESFAGDDRRIVDYLGQEVLAGQPPRVRTFLLRTSVLERLSAPLCDAVVGGTGSAAVLEDLERRNLFLVPLDERREWYRYHHLFAELLRHELGRMEPGLVPTLHRRAQECLEHCGLVPDAIRHAMAAGDYAAAARLIAANWLTYVNRGELETVEAWTSALPPGAAQGDPRLCLARAWMLLVLGRLDEVEPAVRAAERGRLPGPMEDGASSVAASAAMVRTSSRLMLGDLAGARETAREALRHEPDPDAPWRPIATNAAGMTAFWSGALEEARTSFSQTVAAAARVGNHTARIYALGYLAAIEAERGELAEVDRLVESALELAASHDLGEHWVTVMGPVRPGPGGAPPPSAGRGRVAGSPRARAGSPRRSSPRHLLRPAPRGPAAAPDRRAGRGGRAPRRGSPTGRGLPRPGACDAR